MAVDHSYHAIAARRYARIVRGYDQTRAAFANLEKKGNNLVRRGAIERGARLIRKHN